MGEFRSFYTMNLIYFLGLVILASVGAQEDKKIAGVRSPKIFYVSTKEASTTISTHTVCWVSSTTAATTCGRRRKRSVLEIDGDAPQRVKADLLREYEDNQKTVESGVKTDLDDEMIASSGKAVRDPKFMVYWLTTTKSYTSTSYTLTYSVLSVSCTPSGWPYSLCG